MSWRQRPIPRSWSAYRAPGSSDASDSSGTIRYEHVDGDGSMDVVWSTLLQASGVNAGEVNPSTFAALASDPMVGTLP